MLFNSQIALRVGEAEDPLKFSAPRFLTTETEIRPT